MSILITPMGAGHLDAVAGLERVCFSSPWSREALTEELSNPNAAYLVAEEDGQVLGYGGMRSAAGEYYIDNIAVAPEHRRKGVGRALVGALIGRARAEGGSFITLEVRPSNLAAVGLYNSLGFHEEGRRPGFYTRPTEDALIMTLHFGEE